MELIFRQAELADVDLLVEFSRQLQLAEDISFSEESVRGALHELIGNSSLGRAWMVILEGKAVGYMVLTFGFSLEYGGRDAFLDELYVDPGYRGRGVGTRALEFVLSACRDYGVRALHLEVDRENIGALRLYRRAGFGDHDRYLMTRMVR